MQLAYVALRAKEMATHNSCPIYEMRRYWHSNRTERFLYCACTLNMLSLYVYILWVKSKVFLKTSHFMCQNVKDSIWKATLTTKVFVSYDDINLTRQTACFSIFVCKEVLMKQLHGRTFSKTPYFLFPEIFLPVGLMFLYSAFPRPDTQCQMLYEEQ